MPTEPLTTDTVTDEQIRGLQRLDLCRHCECQLAAPHHHVDGLEDRHEYERIGNDFFEWALRGATGEPIDVARDARARAAEIINARSRWLAAWPIG